MTDNEHIKPLDLSRYEGHTPGPRWRLLFAEERNRVRDEKVAVANINLQDDAPLLLAEVRRLRERVFELERKLLDKILSDTNRRVLGEEGSDK